MITDKIANAHLYETLNPRIKQAFDYLRKTDLAGLTPGKHEIDGKNIYALVQDYDSKAKDKGMWEAHRQYIDVQYVVKGKEQIGHAHIERLQQGSYDAEKDYLPVAGDGNFATLEAEDFMILFPHDGHMPGIAAGTSVPVRKVVVKVKVN